MSALNTKPLKRIVVTGGAGQIAYSLLFRIAHGDMLGFNQPIALHILELPAALPALEGVRMELEDCAFPLLKEIHIGTDPIKLFKDIDYALLVGAVPRSPGMERKDLLHINSKVFVEQGKALQASASPNVKVLVVGNPCNTNCLITMLNAPRIPRKNFHAMTRLDQNRAVALLASRSKSDVTEVSNMTIWGNHSATQVPDFVNAKIRGKPVLDLINDRHWLEGEFFKEIQQRGAAILAARGKSSAASAASAIVDAIKAIEEPTAPGHWFSSAICTDGNPYGIPENLVFSFPCISKGNSEYEIVKNIGWDEFLKGKIKLTLQELEEEKKLLGL